jgi:hypothetical protein
MQFVINNDQAINMAGINGLLAGIQPVVHNFYLSSALIQKSRVLYYNYTKYK